jgi:hypothetical protein
MKLSPQSALEELFHPASYDSQILAVQGCKFDFAILIFIFLSMRILHTKLSSCSCFYSQYRRSPISLTSWEIRQSYPPSTPHTLPGTEVAIFTGGLGHYVITSAWRLANWLDRQIVRLTHEMSCHPCCLDTMLLLSRGWPWVHIVALPVAIPKRPCHGRSQYPAILKFLGPDMAKLNVMTADRTRWYRSMDCSGVS